MPDNHGIGSISTHGAVATQRLFFALWPAQALQWQLYAQAAALPAVQHARAVAAHNLHLTLVFLGSVTAAARECVEQAAGGIRGDPFQLLFDQAGYWRRPRVLWMGVSDPPAELLVLVAALNDTVAGCGFAPETRPYAAHMTVARKVRRHPGPVTLAPFVWPVDSFALVESLTLPQGVVYQPLRTWMLHR